jgi:hypothetical protein
MATSEEQLLIRILENNTHRIEILKAVATLSLPDCWVAAGFVRNLVWDYLHNKSTALNDVDVIYYCQSDTQNELADRATRQLQNQLPKVNWQVKNQALMHRKPLHSQYLSSTDAMTYWPEKETAIAIRLDADGAFSIAAPFGLTSLFAGRVTYNQKGNQQVFLQRIKQKSWLSTWPKLVVANSASA